MKSYLIAAIVALVGMFSWTLFSYYFGKVTEIYEQLGAEVPYVTQNARLIGAIGVALGFLPCLIAAMGQHKLSRSLARRMQLAGLILAIFTFLCLAVALYLPLFSIPKVIGNQS
jgi:hypothetical protein